MRRFQPFSFLASLFEPGLREPQDTAETNLNNRFDDF